MAANQDDLIDLVTWAIRDAIRQYRHGKGLPAPTQTFSTLGYGNPKDIRTILENASEELADPTHNTWPGWAITDNYVITTDDLNDDYIAGYAGQRADETARNLVTKGYVVPAP